MSPEQAPRLGVYVHFPWCRKRCPYCDFAIAVAPRGEIPHERYTDAVLEELEARAGMFPERTLVSVYFGGGTPALWRPDQMARVIAAVRGIWGGDDLEITVEANPGDLEPTRLAELSTRGINRLSIGAQSLHDAELIMLGRDHDRRAAMEALVAARAAGFRAISMDLIFALPGRTVDDFHQSLAAAIAADPDHLSVYQLTIEPRSTFGAAVRKGALVPASEPSAAAAFELAHEVLEAARYKHYEVSSYARPGQRSRHNCLYWQGGEYLGLGSGAHSFLRDSAGGTRWSNHRSVKRYLVGRPDPKRPIADDPLVSEVARLGARAVVADDLWLGLRTADGVPAAWVVGRERELERLRLAGLLEVTAERVRPTAKGLLFADEIGTRLMDGPLA